MNLLTQAIVEKDNGINSKILTSVIVLYSANESVQAMSLLNETAGLRVGAGLF